MFEKPWEVLGKTHGKTHLMKKPCKMACLHPNGINVTIRRERGSDIDGACGQLRRRHTAANEGEPDEDICND